MGKGNGNSGLAKNLTRGAAGLVALLLMLGGTARPAYAQYDVWVDGGTIQVNGGTGTIPENQSAASLAQIYALQLQQMTQQSLNSVANSTGQNLQAQAQSQLTDTIDWNTRNTAVANQAMNVTADYMRPSYHSWCHQAESAAMADNDGVGAISQALTQGNQNRQLTNDSLYKQNLDAEMSLGFAPCTDQNDPEYSAWKALGCATVDGGRHEKQDRNLETLLNPLQLPVDPAFQLPQKTGVYTPMTHVTDEKYYPFVAALTFCQHITPIQPTPPKAVSNGNGAPTLDILGVGRYGFSDSTISAGPSACYRALERRMQFDASTNFPAENANAQAGINTRHDEQVARCTEDNAAGYLDDTLLADCQQNGRSDLQADHDRAYRLMMASYQIKVLSVLKTDTEALLVAQAMDDQTKFQDRLEAERNGLIAAIQASHHIPTVYTSNLTQPVANP